MLFAAECLIRSFCVVLLSDTDTVAAAAAADPITVGDPLGVFSTATASAAVLFRRTEQKKKLD